jgi:putative tricarboxylic transport membrane protein
MHSQSDRGEYLLALMFAALGVMWVATALGMPFWEGFAPQSGFVPFWYGVILVGLSTAILVNLLRQKDVDVERPPIGKPLIVLGALACGILGLEPAGFGPAVFLLLLAVFVLVEKLPIVRSAVVAAATTAVLLLLFKFWLGIPLPAGPLGI